MKEGARPGTQGPGSLVQTPSPLWFPDRAFHLDRAAPPAKEGEAGPLETRQDGEMSRPGKQGLEEPLLSISRTG